MAKASVTLHCTECKAVYTVTKTCHKRSEADSWENYMKGNDGLCPECWQKEQRIKKDSEKAQLAEKINIKLSEAGVTLPELIGSEKQVIWANDIRNKVVEQLIKRGFKWDMLATKSYPETLIPEVTKLLEASAKVWIESRGEMIFGMVHIT